MKFNVTEVEFDFTDSQGSISVDEEIEARDLALGVWEADDEDIEWCNIVRKKIDNLMIKC